MLGVEPPKHVRDGAALADELVNHILEVSLSMSVSSESRPYPLAEECGIRGPELFISHDSSRTRYVWAKGIIRDLRILRLGIR
jgi:hypothetical protein